MNLMMESAGSSEMQLHLYETTWCHIQEGRTLHCRHLEGIIF